MWFKVRGDHQDGSGNWVPFQVEIDIPGNICEEILDVFDAVLVESYSLEGFSWSCYD